MVGASEDVWKREKDISGWVAYWRMHGNGIRTFQSWFVYWMMCGDERRTFRGWLVHWRMCGDTTAVPIWSEQPHYKYHSIRLKVRGEGNLSLAVEWGKNECVNMMIMDPKMVRKCRSSK